MSGIKSVLVVHKRSLLEHFKDHPHLSRLGASFRKRILESDLAHRETVSAVFNTLVAARLDFELVRRRDLKTAREYDLVIVIGGDGTFFATARFVRDIPVILVNSDPKHSLGLFSSCTAGNFAPLLADVLERHAKETRLNRFRLTDESGSIDELVLNDMLLAHKNPVAMARYNIRVDGKGEYQEGSGIWVSTAAGSSGAVLSAGGEIMKLSDNRLQYVVREPYRWRQARYKLLKGFASRVIELTPQAIEMAVWIDGSRNVHNIPPGEKIALRTPATPLRLLGFEESRRTRLFAAKGRQ